MRFSVLLTTLAAVLLAAVLSSCKEASYAAPEATFTYYERAEAVTRPVSDLKKDEEWAKQGGHMPWRTDPVFVAAVEAGFYYPHPASAEKEELRDGSLVSVTWNWGERKDIILVRLAGRKGNEADVLVTMNGVISQEIHLKRPFGYWWYVVSE